METKAGLRKRQNSSSHATGLKQKRTTSMLPSHIEGVPTGAGTRGSPWTWGGPTGHKKNQPTTSPAPTNDPDQKCLGKKELDHRFVWGSSNLKAPQTPRPTGTRARFCFLPSPACELGPEVRQILLGQREKNIYPPTKEHESGQRGSPKGKSSSNRLSASRLV